MVDGRIVIDREKCDGCGDCAKEDVCPQGLIRMIPRDATNFIPCSSTEEDDEVVRKTCGYGCIACGECERACPEGAVSIIDNHAVIDYDKCKGCGRCIGACSFDAIYNPNYNANELLDRKMAEYAQAVCYDRPCFHISLVQDISPNCDCHGENDAAVVPDIGMFAGFDPVALDHACIDAVNAAPVIASSVLGQCDHAGHDHFTSIHPVTDWRSQIQHAEAIGLGTAEYELITL